MCCPENPSGSLRGTQSDAKGTEAISQCNYGEIAALSSVARNDNSRRGSPRLGLSYPWARRRHIGYWFVVIGALMAACLLPSVDAHEIPELEETYIQGVFSPRFTPPATGTYDLPIIRRVSPVVLIDAAGRRVNTASLMRGKVAVVSFIYTACTDRLGCPLAGMALRELQAKLLQEGLHDQAVLLSISLDAERDTPPQLTKYARIFGTEPSFWHLLTAPSEKVLKMTLESYGQDRTRVYDARGRFTGRYRHVLKVFLVDQTGGVRNIYSTGSLVPQVMVNDIKTVLADKIAGQEQVR